MARLQMQKASFSSGYEYLARKPRSLSEIPCFLVGHSTFGGVVVCPTVPFTRQCVARRSERRHTYTSLIEPPPTRSPAMKQTFRLSVSAIVLMLAPLALSAQRPLKVYI